MIDPGAALDRAFSALDGPKSNRKGKFKKCPICQSTCSAEPDVFKCHNCGADLGGIQVQMV